MLVNFMTAFHRQNIQIFQFFSSLIIYWLGMVVAPQPLIFTTNSSAHYVPGPQVQIDSIQSLSWSVCYCTSSDH
jgi:hypothetical protein